MFGLFFSLYGLEIKLSIAWQITSRRADAVTPEGVVFDNFGSSKAKVGLKKRCEIRVFNFNSGISRTATEVASDPDPEVVGIAIYGRSSEVGLIPFLIGALT